MSSATKSGVALALICAAQFILQLDFSIVNVALPAIQRELHVSAAHLQWLVTAYALTFGSLLLLGGRIGDMTGHRRLLLAGLSLFIPRRNRVDRRRRGIRVLSDEISSTA